jgi:hypothetical protein
MAMSTMRVNLEISQVHGSINGNLNLRLYTASGRVDIFDGKEVGAWVGIEDYIKSLVMTALVASCTRLK